MGFMCSLRMLRNFLFCPFRAMICNLLIVTMHYDKIKLTNPQ